MPPLRSTSPFEFVMYPVVVESGTVVHPDRLENRKTGTKIIYFGVTKFGCRVFRMGIIDKTISSRRFCSCTLPNTIHDNWRS